MLSKEHLFFREKADHFRPSFISDKGIWLERCQALLNQCPDLLQSSQQACEDIFKEWVAIGEGGILCRRGLLQTFQKKLVWEEHESALWQEQRQKQLASSIQAWRECLTIEDIRESIQTLQQDNKHPLYGDLPHFRKLLKTPKWTAEQWIRRYNLSLVQGFLLRSEHTTWTLVGLQLDKFRYLLRYLNFFGLYYRILEQSEKQIKLRIEGPLDLFSGSKRYQVKLASVAGVLPQLGEFSCHAKVDKSICNKPLQWTSKDKVKSHYRPYFEYKSEERLQFEDKLFEWLEKSKSRLFQPDMNLSELAKGHLPDYAIINEGGEKLHIQIYEKHQKHMLQQRQTLENSSLKYIVLYDKELPFDAQEQDREVNIPFNAIPKFTPLKKLMKAWGF